MSSLLSGACALDYYTCSEIDTHTHYNFGGGNAKNAKWERRKRRKIRREKKMEKESEREAE